MNLVLVVFGGGIDAGSRYLPAGRAARKRFSLGMFAVNAPGSLMIGLAYGLAQRGSLPSAATLFLAVLGGLTTFSAFSCETMRHLANGSIVAVRGLAGA
jgi:fluoride ion exporter CrcB/FEX